MSDILQRILDKKREIILQDKAKSPLSVLEKRISVMEKCRNFYRALAKPNPGKLNVIAEVKKASPSAGLIRKDFDPVTIAKTYQAAGADAISVLTDAPFFQGRLEYLTQVKESVSLPVLRKDFIIDPYQIYEARAAGADAVLLIGEALAMGDLMDLMILAHSLTLTVLLEVHSLDTLMQVRDVIGFPLKNYTLLGVNNRNLKSMTVDLAQTLRLKGMLEEKQVLISESGIKTRADVQRLIDGGVNGVLIGETLMRSEDIAVKFNELFGDHSTEV